MRGNRHTPASSQRRKADGGKNSDSNAPFAFLGCVCVMGLLWYALVHGPKVCAISRMLCCHHRSFL